MLSKKEQLPFPYSRLMHCLEQTKSQSMELVRQQSEVFIHFQIIHFKMFCVLMENEICRKVCEKNKYNSWMKLIGQYCISMA